MTVQPRGRGVLWSAEKTDMLRALAAQKLSRSAIGTQMGITRNAVIGKMNRMGIKSKYDDSRYSRLYRNGSGQANHARSLIPSIKSARSHKKRVTGTRAYNNIAQRINNKAKREAEPVKTVPLNASLDEFNAAIPPWQWVPIIDLTYDHCHWPMWGDEVGGDRFYCGGTIDAGSRVYCRGHASFATAGHSRSYGFTQSIYKFR